MQHTIEINSKGFIEMSFHGPITLEETMNLAPKLLDLAGRLRDKGERVNVLFNLTEAGKMDEQTLRMSSKATREIDFDKLATFGADAFNTANIEKMQTESGKVSNVQLFTTREEAEDWLANES
jgi:hypothetical protein